MSQNVFFCQDTSPKNLISRPKQGKAVKSKTGENSTVAFKSFWSQCDLNLMNVHILEDSALDDNEFTVAEPHWYTTSFPENHPD